MVGCAARSAMDMMGHVSLRVAGFALSMGQRVEHSSVGVELDGFFRVFVFYRGHVRVFYPSVVTLTFWHFSFFSFFLFFHCVCFIVTLNIHMEL